MMRNSSQHAVGWRSAVLGEIGEISGGGTPSTSNPSYWNGPIPWLVPSDVTRNEELFVSGTQRTITEAGLANSNAHLMPSGSVLMTSRATIGEVVINTQPMATNQGFINIKADPEQVSTEFLAYWIMRNKSLFVDRAHGVTFKEITKATFRTIPISLPPLPEQRAIARALRAVQAAKEARERELAIECERKAALMEHLFTHGTRGGPTRLTEIGEMPQGWGIVRLGDICELIQYGTSRRASRGGNGLPVLGIPNIAAGQIDAHNVNWIELSPVETAKLRLTTGDLLFVRTNGRKELLGRCAMYRGEPPGCVFASYLIRARIRPELARPAFIQLFTETGLGHTQLSGKGSNAADGKFNINSQTIRNVLTPLPPMEEQQTIVEILGAYSTKIVALEAEIDLLGELFSASLEELMTGRIRATSPLAQSALP